MVAFFLKERRGSHMFETGEIVLYKDLLCNVKDIIVQKGQTLYILEELPPSSCIIQVPYANAFQHINNVPSKQALLFMLDDVAQKDPLPIHHTMIDKCCQPLADSCRIEDWLMLVKSTLVDKQATALSKHKFHFKEKAYFEKMITSLSVLYAYVLEIEMEEAQQLLLYKLSSTSS